MRPHSLLPAFVLLAACIAQAAAPRYGLADAARLGEPDHPLTLQASDPEPEPAPAIDPARADRPLSRSHDRVRVAGRDPGPRLDAQAPDPRPLPRWIVHDSVPRETIDALAIRYGVKSSKLRQWNGLSPTGGLNRRAPQDLRVHAQRLPAPREPITHEVLPGETWSSIARRYAVIPGRLRRWNKEEVGKTLEPDEVLTVWIEPAIYDAMLHDRPTSARAASIPPGGHSVGTPQAGRVVNAVQLPPGEGYHIRFPNSAWGTTWTMRNLVAALDEFHETSDYEGTLFVGTIGRRRGGEIGGHVSHQSGRDVDIRLPVKRGVPTHIPPRGRRVAWDATWELILALVRTGSVKLILLDRGGQRRLRRYAQRAGYSQELIDRLIQYPQNRAEHGALIHHSPGHEGHIHVRFSCAPYEPECGDI